MKVTRLKSTGRIFEGQSRGNERSMVNHASCYHPLEDIEFLEMDDTEFHEAIKQQNIADMTPDRKIKKLIREEEKKLLRQQAIDALKAEGKIPQEYEVF